MYKKSPIIGGRGSNTLLQKSKKMGTPPLGTMIEYDNENDKYPAQKYAFDSTWRWSEVKMILNCDFALSSYN